MTHPNPLTELASRVERLTGPCRETDALIDVAVRGGPGAGFPAWIYTNFPTWRVRAGGRVEVVHTDGTGGVHWTPKPYTASLDAVMTLAAEGYYIIAIHQMPNGWIVKIGSRSNDQEPVIDEEHTSLTHALCSAWLRARASMEADRG